MNLELILISNVVPHIVFQFSDNVLILSWRVIGKGVLLATGSTVWCTLTLAFHHAQAVFLALCDVLDVHLANSW